MSNKNNDLLSILKGVLGGLVAAGGIALGRAIAKYQIIQNKLNNNESLSEEEEQFLRKVDEIRFGLVDVKKLFDWEDEENY